MLQGRDPQDALALSREAIAIYPVVTDRRSILQTLHPIAAAVDRHDLATARTALTDLVMVSDDLSDRRLLAYLLKERVVL